MAEKELKIKVVTETDIKNLDGLDKKLEDTKGKIDSLNAEKVQLKIDADTEKLSDVKSKITELENKKAELKVGVDDDEIKSTEQEIKQLDDERIQLELNLETHKLDELQAKKDDIEKDEIDIQLRNQSAMAALGQIADGFSRIKAAASEVGEKIGTILESAGTYETNFKFLEHAIGNADIAKQKMTEIDSIVRQLPGDDTALGGLLSSAVAKDSSLTADNLRNMATSAADYMSAMDYYGKSSIEAQQDLTNYLLAGNTAELERSPILQGHIDKLKEATTVQERSKALAEALNEEHWGGMSTQDTYNNKLQEFNAMLETGKRDLGGMFREGAKGGMEFLLTLNEATGGLVGMTIAASEFVSPVADAVMGIGQMATGIKSLKDLGVIKWFKDLELGQKAVAAAQWLVNTAMGANPIYLIVIAIIALVAILWYLYNTCEPVRNAIDGIWAGVTSAIQPIIDAVQWLIDELTRLADGDWTVTIELVKAGADAGVDAGMDMANNDLSRGIVSMLMGDEALTQVDEQMPAFKEKVSTSLNEMLDSIWNDGTQGFLGWLAGIAGIDVGSYLAGLQTSLNNIPVWVNQTGQSAIQGFKNMYDGARQWLDNIINNVKNFGVNLYNSITQAAHNAWQSFVNNIKGMWHHMQEEVDSILSEADRLLRELPGKLWNAAVRMVQGWLTGSGEGSPGFMYYAFEEDLGAMERISRNNNIAGNMEDTARSMVNNWSNNSQLEVSGSNNGSGDVPVSYTFNLYGDIDNEERMQKFLDAVRRELEWNNNTAGRSVRL